MRGIRVNKEKYILEQLELFAKKKVLHVGCTNSPNTIHRWDTGTLLHKNLCDVANRIKANLVGIDIDDKAIKFLQKKMPNSKFLNIDAHKLWEYFREKTKFDLIIAGDVIEHLPNPGIFLKSCERVLVDDGKIIISTSNSFGIIRFVKSLLFHEAVHSEHTAYYSPKTLDRLLQMNGLTIEKYNFYKSEPVTKFSLNRYFSNTIESISCIIWPHFSEGIIIKAYKKI